MHEGKEAINKFFLDLPYSAVALNVEDGAVDAQACGKSACGTWPRQRPAHCCSAVLALCLE